MLQGGDLNLYRNGKRQGEHRLCAPTQGATEAGECVCQANAKAALLGL